MKGGSKSQSEYGDQSEQQYTMMSFIPHPSSFILHPLDLLPHWSEDYRRVVRDTHGESGVMREAREAFYSSEIKPKS
jgi:hypothetical protein